MNTIKTAPVECALNTLFYTVRADLEEKFRRNASKAAVAVEDLVGDAFGYVCAGVLDGKVKMPMSGKDLCRLVAAKAALLLKDTFRASGCEHGRRSLRVLRSLDEILGEGSHVLTDAASYARYADGLRAEECAYRRKVAVKTLHRVFEKMDMTPINRKIYFECVLGEMPRDVVAKKYGTTRNNTDAIVARTKKALAKYGPEIFEAIYNKAA